MKQFLILLSSITTLTISSNTFSNLNQNTNLTNNLQTNNNNDNQNSLFNNQYSYLSDSDWITNQPTADHKFYSYNTSALKNYTFANARKTFLVDTTGNLVYNTKVTVPDKDKSDIENTKQEMISHKKITTVKDSYNPYSKSEYSKTYFSGNNTDWQYIQFGGFPTHIDISKQEGADKVENSNCLSETLGLYYIAKATRDNKITKKITNNLSTYFISQSSLKDQINDKLAIEIINLIISNNDIYNFIYNAPMIDGQTNLYKNYSMNYIFDNDNNLIEIYYNKWEKNINKTVHFNYENWFNGRYSTNNINYDGYNYNNIFVSKQIMFSWIDFARDWNTFIKIYPTLTFDENSVIGVSCYSYRDSQIHGKNININTNQINDGSSSKNSIKFSIVSIFYNYSIFTAYIEASAWIWMWHDNNNVYVNIGGYEHLENAQQGLHFWINLNYCILNSIMN